MRGNDKKGMSAFASEVVKMKWQDGELRLQSGEIFSGQILWPSASRKPFFDRLDSERSVPRGVGEVVFSTAHSGYEEMSTDPSYYGQMLLCTAPEQGNYGILPSTQQSGRHWISAFLCSQIQDSDRDRSFLHGLWSKGVPVMRGLDTRALTRRLAKDGTTIGWLQDRDLTHLTDAPLSEFAQLSRDWAKVVSVKSTARHDGRVPLGPRVVVLDFGIKQGILNQILLRSSEVFQLPSGASLQEVESFGPQGVVLSNGPGDPRDLQGQVSLVKSLIGRYPLFGICLGHQILALALGLKVVPLRFGHRAANHPVFDSQLGKTIITSQNHGYVVESSAGTLVEDVLVSHVHLNDGTVAGLSSKVRRFFSVQFHPENRPGPRDAEYLFDRAFDLIQGRSQTEDHAIL